MARPKKNSDTTEVTTTKEKKYVETPLMKQYYQIKAVHPDAILLFRVGDFYETFGDDAIKASGILGITLTRRANGAASYVELAGFPHHALDNYMPKLVRAGERVAICEQLEDPNAGLAWFSAFEAVLGNGYVDENGEGQNFFYYDGRPIMPRGMWARFVPDKTGVYRITSHTDYKEGLDAWIFDRNSNLLYEYSSSEMMEGMYADQFNISMTVFLVAGVDYYIDIAMYDVYGVGYITYDIEYVGESAQIFKQCSPGPFTFDLVSGKTIIGPHPAVILGEDGYYHEDLGKDMNGNQIYGSIIYAYFAGPTSMISTPVTQMINMGGFDFTKTDYDLEILAYLNQHNGDIEATDAYLHELWGDEYAYNLHCHFSKIEYTTAGEKKHLTFEDTVFGPEFDGLAEAIVREGVCPRIICESAGTMAEDALFMKNMYLSAKESLS